MKRLLRSLSQWTSPGVQFKPSLTNTWNISHMRICHKLKLQRHLQLLWRSSKLQQLRLKINGSVGTVYEFAELLNSFVKNGKHGTVRMYKSQSCDCSQGSINQLLRIHSLNNKYYIIIIISKSLMVSVCFLNSFNCAIEMWLCNYGSIRAHPYYYHWFSQNPGFSD